MKTFFVKSAIGIGALWLLGAGTACTSLHFGCDTMTLNKDFRLHELSGNIYCMGTTDTLENGMAVWNLTVIKDRRRRLEVYPLTAVKNTDQQLDSYLRSRDSGTLKTYVMDDAGFYEFCRRKLKRSKAGYMMRMP